MVGAVIIQSDTWRIILGLPFMLFSPGYILQSALFPKKTDLDSIERIGFGFVLSIVVVSLIGLGLNYSPWGITTYSVLIATLSFVILVGIITWFRRSHLGDERDNISSSAVNFANFKTMILRNKPILFLFTLGILLCIGFLVFSVMAAPKMVDKFTQFYILGLDGKVADYPIKAVIGEESSVICNITNHEHQETKYEIVIKINGVTNREIGPITLANNQSWMNIIGFIPTEVADNQMIDILLYINNQNNSYGSLFFKINVLPKRPVISFIGDKSVAEGSPIAFTISATDQGGKPLTYTATNLPRGASLQGQTFFWTPEVGQSGIYPGVTFTVSNGLSDTSETITITVNKIGGGNAQVTPVINPIGDKSVVEGSPIAFTISATDQGGKPLTYTATNLPRGASLQGQTFFWTPEVGQSGIYPGVTFMVSNGSSMVSESITITVSK